MGCLFVFFFRYIFFVVTVENKVHVECFMDFTQDPVNTPPPTVPCICVKYRFLVFILQTVTAGTRFSPHHKVKHCPLFENLRSPVILRIQCERKVHVY